MDEIDELAELIVQKSGLSVQVELKRLVKEITSMIRALVARERAAAAEAVREAAIDAGRAAISLTASVEDEKRVERAIRSIQLPDAAPKPQALRVPDGWRLVPVEPTEAMKRAAFGPIMAGGRFGPLTADNIRQQAAIGVFQKMLDAAPAPPSDGGKE